MSNTVPVLYIDPVCGCSGDMFLGALVDVGADFDALCAMLGRLDLRGFRLERRPEFRHSIAGTKIDVVVEDKPHVHRRASDLIAIVERADLPERVRLRSVAVLNRLADAESLAHRMSPGEVHLHEVGGLDALVDIVGTCCALELLDVSRIYSGPVALGTGVVRCAHGVMPLPAPGTLAALEGMPVRRTNFNHEMTTPTGAAIIGALAVGFAEPLVMVPLRTGYGAGTSNPREFANLLRVVLCQVPPRLLPAHYHGGPIEPRPSLEGREGSRGHAHDHDHHHGHSHPH